MHRVHGGECLSWQPTSSWGSLVAYPLLSHDSHSTSLSLSPPHAAGSKDRWEVQTDMETGKCSYMVIFDGFVTLLLNVINPVWHQVWTYYWVKLEVNSSKDFVSIHVLVVNLDTLGVMSTEIPHFADLRIFRDWNKEGKSKDSLILFSNTQYSHSYSFHNYM